MQKISSLNYLLVAFPMKTEYKIYKISITIWMTFYLFFHLYKLKKSKNNRIIYKQQNEGGLALDMRPQEKREILRNQIQKILELTPSLKSYFPTFWASNNMIQVILLTLKCEYDKKILRFAIKREEIITQDKALISIDFADDIQTRKLQNNAPILILLHTVTGCGNDTIYFLKETGKIGWRGCVFNRRGNGSELQTPNFNFMGNADDVRTCVRIIQDKYPDAYLAMAGISAGSGLLITYLGQEGQNTPIKCAVSLCPAWNITQAFQNLAQKYPFINYQLTKAIKKNFITKSPKQEKMLRDFDNNAVNYFLSSKNLDQILKRHWAFSGCESQEDYLFKNNPMEYNLKIQIPIMILNSDDDLVCLPENVDETQVQNFEGVLLVRTSKGSHIAYHEGFFGSGNYMVRSTLDFVQSAKKVHQMNL